MIKKGIILAGGRGTRMSPLTKAVNKQLLPIHDKPLIFYPLSILMLAGIKDILIIVNKGQLSQYKKFINNQNVFLILGDNFFYGQNLSKILQNCSKLKNGAKVLLHRVNNPESFGVAKVLGKKIKSIKEKPKKFLSDLAITGLYFFDKKVCNYAKKLKPSKRGELEIVDLLNFYLRNKKLSAELIGRGGAWLDTGSIEDFYKTSAFVSAIENRQGFKIACLEEIAFNNKWINKKQLKNAIMFYGNCSYSDYIKKLI